MSEYRRSKTIFIQTSLIIVHVLSLSVITEACNICSKTTDYCDVGIDLCRPCSEICEGSRYEPTCEQYSACEDFHRKGSPKEVIKEADEVKGHDAGQPVHPSTHGVINKPTGPPSLDRKNNVQKDLVAESESGKIQPGHRKEESSEDNTVPVGTFVPVTVGLVAVVMVAAAVFIFLVVRNRNRNSQVRKITQPTDDGLRHPVPETGDQVAIEMQDMAGQARVDINQVFGDQEAGTPPAVRGARPFGTAEEEGLMEGL